MPNLAHKLVFFAYAAAMLALRAVPAGVVFCLGGIAGALAFALLPGRRVIACRNIRRSLGLSRSGARKIAFGSFVKIGANLACTAKLQTMPASEILGRVTFSIPEGTFANGGALLASAHTGNWELLPRLAELIPHIRFGAIYQKLANPLIDRRVREAREKRGARLFDRAEEFWDALAFLESGGSLGLLCDQNAGQSGTWVPLFRRLASTSTLPGLLAARARVPVIPVWVSTVGVARWHICAGAPIFADSPEGVAARLNAELESEIRKHPSDWLWAHSRWKCPPFGHLLGGARIFVPPGPAPEPYRVAVVSPCEPAEAERALGAIRSIKASRPDAEVSMIAERGPCADFWASEDAVKRSIALPRDAPFLNSVKTVRRAGGFDLGIALAPEAKSSALLKLAGIPVVIGVPHRRGLNEPHLPPGADELPDSGEGRYLAIAEIAGASVR